MTQVTQTYSYVSIGLTNGSYIDLFTNSECLPSPDTFRFLVRIPLSNSTERVSSAAWVIADLALWSGWGPANLQPYLDFLDGKEVDKEAKIENESTDCLFSSITASLEDFQE